MKDFSNFRVHTDPADLRGYTERAQYKLLAGLIAMVTRVTADTACHAVTTVSTPLVAAKNITIVTTIVSRSWAGLVGVHIEDDLCSCPRLRVIIHCNIYRTRSEGCVQFVRDRIILASSHQSTSTSLTFDLIILPERAQPTTSILAAQVHSVGGLCLQGPTHTYRFNTHI